MPKQKQTDNLKWRSFEIAVMGLFSQNYSIYSEDRFCYRSEKNFISFLVQVDFFLSGDEWNAFWTVNGIFEIQCT